MDSSVLYSQSSLEFVLDCLFGRACIILLSTDKDYGQNDALVRPT